MYTHILPNDNTRMEALECFFYSYINMYPVGTIVSPLRSGEAIGYIFYPYTNINKFYQAKDFIFYSINLANMMKHISIKEFILFIKAIYNNSSKWIEEFVEGEFIHIDLIVVNENYRNKGLAKIIINDVLKKADEQNLPTTLETQNPVNVQIYKKLGFEVVKKQKYENLIQYCMIRKAKSKSKY